MLRDRLNVRAAVVLICLSWLTTSCGARTYRFEHLQRQVDRPNVYPWRVAAVIDKQFTPYKIKFQYWSTPLPSTLPFDFCRGLDCDERGDVDVAETERGRLGSTQWFAE